MRRKANMLQHIVTSYRGKNTMFTTTPEPYDGDVDEAIQAWVNEENPSINDDLVVLQKIYNSHYYVTDRVGYWRCVYYKDTDSTPVLEIGYDDFRGRYVEYCHPRPRLTDRPSV